ncbi:MAG: glycosyltransferase family 4 protein [Marinilabiliales bacterium]
MKIAYLSTFYPFRGGIAQFNASLLKAFIKQGHEAKAFTFKVQYPDFLFPGKTQFVTPEDNTEVIDSIRVLNTLNPVSYIKTAKKIKDFKPDLLLMKYWLPYFGPSLGYVAKQTKKYAITISILDNVIPHEKRLFDKSFTKYFLKHNNGFVVMSDAVKNDLLKFNPNAKFFYREHPLYDHFGEKKDRTKACNHFSIDPAKKVILFFGLIRKYKGLDILINAFGKLDDSYELIIAGEAYDDVGFYKNLINNNKNKDRIHFFDRYISDDEVPWFFSAADVVVLPYRSATQSGITSIAYHFEIPVIATNTGGLKEIVVNNKYGLIIEDNNENKIAEIINYYFNNNLKNKFAENIKQKKLECSWDNFAKAIVKFSQTL